MSIRTISTGTMSAGPNDRARFSTFIGVDLGGGKGKNTAVALLSREKSGASVRYVGTKSTENQPFHDDTLISFVRAHHADAVLAIDAPLKPTVCVRCRLDVCPGLDVCVDPVVDWFRRTAKTPITPYTQRACEIYLAAYHGISARETLGQGMGPLTARARYLCRALESSYVLNGNLLEVYPKATIHQLFGEDSAARYKRQVNTWQTRATILERLSDTLQFEVWREGCLANDHCFDAVICAYTAYLWAEQNWQMPTENREIFEQDGWIWIPPAKL